MTGENLRPGIIFANLPEGSANQDDIPDSLGLEDSSTLKAGCEFLFQVEWVWLNSDSEAINMTFQNPSAALLALGRGRRGIDEGAHRPHLVPTSPL